MSSAVNLPVPVCVLYHIELSKRRYLCINPLTDVVKTGIYYIGIVIKPLFCVDITSFIPFNVLGIGNLRLVCRCKIIYQSTQCGNIFIPQSCVIALDQ